MVPNLAVVPTGICQSCGEWTGYPAINIFSSAQTHLIVDVMAIFDDGQLLDGLRFEPITPVRIMDTRTGLGGSGVLGPHSIATVTASGGDPWEYIGAVALNVTAVNPTHETYLTLWPKASPEISQPLVSNLNPVAGRATPNASITVLGPQRKFNVFNSAGQCHVLADVVGRYFFALGDPHSANGMQATSGGTATNLPLLRTSAGNR